MRSTVHSLICEAFHGQRPRGMEVRHLNGNRRDNRSENLSWGTRSENAADRLRHGTDWNGDKHKSRVLSGAVVIDLRTRRKRGDTYAKISKDTGIGYSTAYKAIRGASWRSVGEERGGCYR